MITAAFAHGSWDHLLGNLFFFFAFAASVEMILGMLSYVLIFATLAVGTHLSYSLAMMNVNDALPTLGLSGVVMGMIGVFVYLMPKINIRCFFWFFVIFRIVKAPAWLLAAWYVSWDIYALYFSEDQSAINFIAHLSGATIGFGLGLIFLVERKEKLQIEMRQHQEAEELELQKEE
jgi:membrane associated rhomboid family serine protease